MTRGRRAVPRGATRLTASMLTASMLAASMLAASMLAACSAEPARIVVVTDTDLAFPAEIDSVRIEVDASAAGSGREVRMTVLDGATVSPPVVLAVVHDGGSLGPITVTASGLLDGDVVIERRARLSFVPGRSILLRLDLLRACGEEDCNGNETCAAGACVPIDVDGEALPTWQGRGALGAPLSASDGGSPMDAAVDPPDGGPIAAGRDANLACHDGCACAQECVGSEGCSCNAGCECVLACVPERSCSNVACDGSGTACLIDGAGTASVQAKCDHLAHCTIDARGSTNATGLDCRNDSTCEADCRGAIDCHLKCESEALCLLTCDPGSVACDLECSGELLDCGNGVFACNRACP